jgi:protein phosphatase
MTESPAATRLSTRRLVVQAVLRTDVGKVRSENQDFAALTNAKEEAVSPAGGRLLIVADGMGGHRGGATASRVATETVKTQYLSSETKDVATALHEALTRANAKVFSESQINPDLRGMGTTTSALVIRGAEAWFAHVGDSRIYMVRNDTVEQLTEDHSLVATMVREGLLTAQEAENHPRRNVLQRSIGVGEEVEIDVRGPIELQENDTFVLCSDGLHGLVKEAEIKDIAKLPIQQAANDFVKLALERGAPDNVTVIVARIVRADQLGEDTVIDEKEGDRSLFEETMKDHEVASLRRNH